MSVVFFGTTVDMIPYTKYTISTVYIYVQCSTVLYLCWYICISRGYAKGGSCNVETFRKGNRDMCRLRVIGERTQGY